MNKAIKIKKGSTFAVSYKGNIRDLKITGIYVVGDLFFNKTVLEFIDLDDEAKETHKMEVHNFYMLILKQGVKDV